MTHLRLLLFLQLMIVLVAFLPLILVSRLERAEVETAAAVAAWMIILYSSVRLGMLAADGRQRLVSMTFWIFVYVWLGITPLLQVLSGSFPLPGLYSATQIIVALGVVLLGLLAYDVGGTLGREKAVSTERGIPRAFLRRLSPPRAVIVALIAMLVAGVLILKLGGPAALFVSRDDLASKIREITGTDGKTHYLLFVTALRTPVFVAAYLLLIAYLRGHRSVRVTFCMLLCGFASIAINNPINSPRYWMGVTVLGCLYFVVPWSKSMSFGVYTLATVLLLLFIFPYADLFRYSTEVNLPSSISTNALVEKADYDAFQQLMNAVACAHERGWAYGWQFLGTVLFWVPRRIWPTKPVASGTLVAEASGYRYHNLSLPLWGEFYLDGGVIAMIAMFLAYGYMTRRLESYYLSPRAGQDSFVRLLVPLYAAFQVFILRGTLMAAIAYLLPVVALVWSCTVPQGKLVAPARDTRLPRSSSRR